MVPMPAPNPSPDAESTEAHARGAALDGRLEARLRALRAQHFELLWRALRRFGVPESDVDDAVQDVLIVATRRLDDITQGKERAFLLATAVRVAARVRRTRRRRPEEPESAADPADPTPSAEVLVDRHRARAVLDHILDAMPEELRAAFVLFELEELTVPEIAEVVGVPLGTAASRLRRAREVFREELAKRTGHEGRSP